MFSLFIFIEVKFRRHDPKYLKEYMKKLNVIWLYSHEELLLGELSQQGVLVKSRIPTPMQMVQTNREAKKEEG